MRKGTAITVYLSEEATTALDAEVERRAKQDRAQGLTGYAVTNRSKLTSEIITDYLINLDDDQLTFEKIRQIVVPFFEQYGVKRAVLYGSYARAQQTPESDIDIAIEKGALRGLEFFKLQHQLSDCLGKQVDLQTIEPDSDFYAKIQNDAKELYAC